MFADLSPWAWVAIAWGEVLVAYGAYLAYLSWRERQARRTGRSG